MNSSFHSLSQTNLLANYFQKVLGITDILITEKKTSSMIESEVSTENSSEIPSQNSSENFTEKFSEAILGFVHLRRPGEPSLFQIPECFTLFEKIRLAMKLSPLQAPLFEASTFAEHNQSPQLPSGISKWVLFDPEAAQYLAPGNPPCQPGTEVRTNGKYIVCVHSLEQMLKDAKFKKTTWDLLQKLLRETNLMISNQIQN